jgi:hypothetical protein
VTTLLTVAKVVSPLEQEFCVFEEAGQEILVAAERGQGTGGLLAEMIDIGGREVGLASVLDVAPHAFHGIQLGTVGRQGFEAEPRRMLDREVLGRLEMGPEIVPDEHNPAPKTMVQVTQEWDQKRRVDVAIVQLKEEVHSSANRRDRKRTDRRESITPGRFGQDGRLPRRCPGSTDGRLEHEAGFVQEHYRLTPTGRPFFIRGHSTFRQRSSASGSCCRARRWGFCSVRASCRRSFST